MTSQQQQLSNSALQHQHKVSPTFLIPHGTTRIPQLYPDEVIPPRKELLIANQLIMTLPATELVDFAPKPQGGQNAAPARAIKVSPRKESFRDSLERVNKYHGDTHWRISHAKNGDSVLVYIVRVTYFRSEGSVAFEDEVGSPCLRENAHYKIPLEEWKALLATKSADVTTPGLLVLPSLLHELETNRLISNPIVFAALWREAHAAINYWPLAFICLNKLVFRKYFLTEIMRPREESDLDTGGESDDSSEGRCCICFQEYGRAFWGDLCEGVDYGEF
ncbi:hypothetical protein Vi05172_g3255 [Venturia inaequalis]|nr:hypothetical protein Vi05172_g3255 [Venturia inaequalis]